MLSNTNTNRIIFISLLLVTFNLLLSNITDFSKTIDISKEKTIDSFSSIIDSMEYRVKKLENAQEDIDDARALWGTALDKSNVIFSAFITILILLFGIGYFTIFKGYLKYWEKKYVNKIQLLELKALDNESLVYRNMYYNCINSNLFESSLLWGSRVLIKEIEKIPYKTQDYHRICDFISNMSLVSKNIKNKKIKLSISSIHEIISNCEEVLKKYGNELKKEEVLELTNICKEIVN